MSTLPTAQTQKSPAKSYQYVLYVLLLRDIRTRFGASLLSCGAIVL
jgi:capsular polysaccharide transport system permease protein